MTTSRHTSHDVTSAGSPPASAPRESAPPESRRDIGRVDVQVVGGGIAGLAAAALVSAAGASVRVFEKRPTPGGRARSDEHHGFVLNRGPHALYRSGALSEVLDRLGIDVPAVPPAQRSTTGELGGRAGKLPVGPITLATTPLLSLRSKLTLARLMTVGMGRIDPAALASTTVDDWLDDLTGEQDLRTLLWGLVNLTTYNAASDLTSADAAVTQLRLAATAGVVYVHGGWATVVDALGRRVPDRAVTVREVVQVGSDGGETWCRTSDGVTCRAGATIVATGLPAAADRLLGTGDRFASTAGPPVEASALDLGLRRAPRAPGHFGLDRALYASVHSVAAGLAPAGTTLLSVARYRRPGDTSSPLATRDELRRFAGENGVGSGDIVMERYLHRSTVTGGMPLATSGGLGGRPAVEVPDHDGVFLAGDWVGPEGLLADASAASARAAAAAAVARVRRRQGMLVP